MSFSLPFKFNRTTILKLDEPCFQAIMAPKKAKTKLMDLEFNADELAEAREELKALDNKHEEKRRLEAKMTYFVKQSGELAPGDRLTGCMRREWLLRYMAKQSKDRAATSSSTSTHTVGTISETKGTGHWWCKEQMETNLGKARAAKWIASGKLQKRACPVTGSMDDDDVEWRCPQDADIKTGTDQVLASTETRNDVAAGSFGAAEATIQDAAECLVGGPSAAAAISVVVKTEPGEPTPPASDGGDNEKSPAQQLASLDVVANTTVILRKLRYIDMYVKAMRINTQE